ncbi:MAG: hypothetical protein QOD99_580 [Chthoniobacter sp.]|nr:hypothetical protein [Chthoniobacter sp.]
MNARVSSLTATPELLMPWRTIANEHDRTQLEFEMEKRPRAVEIRKQLREMLAARNRNAVS